MRLRITSLVFTLLLALAPTTSAFVPMSTPPESPAAEEADDFAADIKRLKALAEKIKDDTTLSDFRKELTDSIVNLETAGKRARLLSTLESDLKTPEAIDLAKKLRHRQEVPTMQFIGDIAVNVNGEEDEPALSPALSATFRPVYYLDRNKLGMWAWQPDFTLQIQAPRAASDSLRLVNRLIRSGADGILQLGAKIGLFGIGRGIALGASGNVNWLNEKATENASFSSLAYLSNSARILAWWGPAVIGLETEWRWVTGETTSYVADGIDRAVSHALAIGLRTDKQSLFLRYLLDGNYAQESNENLEVRIGVAYAPF